MESALLDFFTKNNNPVKVITNKIAVNWCITPSQTKMDLFVAFTRVKMPNKTWREIREINANLNLLKAENVANAFVFTKKRIDTMKTV